LASSWVFFEQQTGSSGIAGTGLDLGAWNEVRAILRKYSNAIQASVADQLTKRGIFMNSPASLPLLGLSNPRRRTPSLLIPIFGDAGGRWLQNIDIHAGRGSYSRFLAPLAAIHLQR
jgi:hypothetical protein